LRAEWVDVSARGDGSAKASGDEVGARLAGRVEAPEPAAPAAAKRYFGAGDVLRNATLEFGAGASVEMESLFEQCTISLSEGTELIIGKGGVMRGCQVRGAGKLTVNGTFVERASPGLDGISELVVSAEGSIVSALAQPPEYTRFAFEPGCVLRMKIMKPTNDSRVVRESRDGSAE
jgi:hypothetical protein